MTISSQNFENTLLFPNIFLLSLSLLHVLHSLDQSRRTCHIVSSQWLLVFRQFLDRLSDWLTASPWSSFRSSLFFGLLGSRGWLLDRGLGTLDVGRWTLDFGQGTSNVGLIWRTPSQNLAAFNCLIYWRLLAVGILLWLFLGDWSPARLPMVETGGGPFVGHFTSIRLVFMCLIPSLSLNLGSP